MPTCLPTRVPVSVCLLIASMPVRSVRYAGLGPLPWMCKQAHVQKSLRAFRLQKILSLLQAPRDHGEAGAAVGIQDLRYLEWDGL